MAELQSALEAAGVVDDGAADLYEGFGIDAAEVRLDGHGEKVPADALSKLVGISVLEPTLTLTLTLTLTPTLTLTLTPTLTLTLTLTRWASACSRRWSRGCPPKSNTSPRSAWAWSPRCTLRPSRSTSRTKRMPGPQGVRASLQPQADEVAFTSSVQRPCLRARESRVSFSPIRYSIVLTLLL